MRLFESLDVAKNEARVVIRRAHGAGDKRIWRPGVRAKYFLTVEFWRSIHAGQASAD